MIISQYQVDAFASSVFEGNPAAVCVLDDWLDDGVMQSIAAENNLAETAFFIRKDEHYAIRWFTPTMEVELCGHATLASAFVLFDQLGFSGESVSFDSLSGVLTVTRKGDLFEMEFPSQVPELVDIPKGLEEALGAPVLSCLFNQDYVVILESQEVVESLKPNLNLLEKIECRGVIVTARASNPLENDFVCRFFGPRIGISEDSVTGSAFTKLIPFWAQELSKTSLKARQVSQRGGDVVCQFVNYSVKMAGKAVLFSKGEIYV